MNNFQNLIVKGYDYDGMKIGIVGDGPIKTERDLIDYAFTSPENQVHLTLVGKNAKIPGATKHYVFMVQTDPEAMRKAKKLAPRNTLVVGLATIGRADRSSKIGERKEFFLEDLDTQHMLDRFRSELIHWHAESFGHGPHSPEGKAAIKAHSLAKSTPGVSKRARVGRM